MKPPTKRITIECAHNGWVAIATDVNQKVTYTVGSNFDYFMSEIAELVRSMFDGEERAND